jgi:uncharacterized protein YlxP (DUF503 family)
VRHDACIGVLLAELHFPQSRSLKEKRAPLASLRDAVHARFRASFSEVGLHDVWQRARILVVLAASSLQQASQQMDEIDRYLHSQEFEVSRVLVKSTDTVAALWDIDF